MSVGDVPDQQLLAAAALVADQQPAVAGQRAELQRVQAAALAVPLLGDDGRRSSVVPAARSTRSAG